MKPLHLKICVITIIVLFIVLLFTGAPSKALSLLFISGGILGLITKTMPFSRPPKFPSKHYKISYDEDSIIKPLINILFIFVGLIAFTA